MASSSPQPVTRNFLLGRILLGPIIIIGGRAIGLLEFLGGVGYLLLDTVVSIPRGLISKRGRRLGWQNLWAQMVRVGVRSVPIVMLVLFCIAQLFNPSLLRVEDKAWLDEMADRRTAA